MKNIIFDFDGTLFDSSKGIYEAYALSCDAVKVSCLPKVAFIKHIGPPIISIAEKLYPNLSQDQLVEFVHSFRFHYDKYLYLKSYPYQDVFEMLTYLHSCDAFNVIGVVTNKPTILASRLLSNHNLSHFFDKIVGIDFLSTMHSSERFESKSDAILFFKSLFPGNDFPYIYIGDTFSDQNAAKSADCDFISVNYGYNNWTLSQNKPSICVESVVELISELKVLAK